jgi:hypothetical protein
MLPSESTMAERSQGLRSPHRCLSSRLLAACASVLVVPLFIAITLALLSHGQWQTIIRESYKADNGETFVRLVFNTRARTNRAKTGNRHCATSRERLMDFLRSTRLSELPCLFQYAFGYYEVDTSIAVPRSFVSWRSLSAWANAVPVPQRRYGDMLMAEFNEACNNGDIALATRLFGEIETDLAGPLRMEPDEPRELSNQYFFGNKRLTLIDQRLWSLRHPEPRQRERK